MSLMVLLIKASAGQCFIQILLICTDVMQSCPALKTPRAIMSCEQVTDTLKFQNVYNLHHIYTTPTQCSVVGNVGRVVVFEDFLKSTLTPY